MTTYEELEAACLPFIESYKDDLLVHDRKTLTEWPGVPFLHFTRKYGTQLILMPPADHGCWPQENEVVPYLFGEANRGHILNEKLSMAKYPYEGLRIVHSCHQKWGLLGGEWILEEEPVQFAVARVERYITYVKKQWADAKWKASSQSERRQMILVRETFV